MSKIKTIRNTRKTMQRLGFLKLICKIAQNKPDTIQNFSEKLYQIVSKKYSINFKDNKDIFKLFIEKKLDISTRYKYINWETIKTNLKNDSSEDLKAELEIQDVYLSSYILPSVTGAIIPTEKAEMISFAKQLGFLQDNLILTAEGTLIKNLSKDIYDLFCNYNPKKNPFKLDVEDKVVFLYYLLCKDYDILKFLIPKLVKIKTFSIEEQSEHIYNVITGVLKSKETETLSFDEKEYINKLSKTAESIKNPKGFIQGTGRSIYQFFLPRIEWFCDLSIVEKLDPTKSKYKITKNCTILSKYLEKYELRDLLNNHFFEMSSCLYDNKAGENKLTNEEVISIMKEVSSDLQSQVGYIPLTEGIIYTNLHLLKSQYKTYIEISNYIEIIKKYQKKNPKSIKYGIDRMGNIISIKFV